MILSWGKDQLSMIRLALYMKLDWFERFSRTEVPQGLSIIDS